MTCSYCKGTGKLTLLSSIVPCSECANNGVSVKLSTFTMSRHHGYSAFASIHGFMLAASAYFDDMNSRLKSGTWIDIENNEMPGVYHTLPGGTRVPNSPAIAVAGWADQQDKSPSMFKYMPRAASMTDRRNPFFDRSTRGGGKTESLRRAYGGGEQRFERIHDEIILPNIQKAPFPWVPAPLPVGGRVQFELEDIDTRRKHLPVESDLEGEITVSFDDDRPCPRRFEKYCKSIFLATGNGPEALRNRARNTHLSSMVQAFMLLDSVPMSDELRARVCECLSEVTKGL